MKRAKKKLRVGTVGIGHYFRKRFDIHAGNDVIVRPGILRGPKDPQMKGW